MALPQSVCRSNVHASDWGVHGLIAEWLSCLILALGALIPSRSGWKVPVILTGVIATSMVGWMDEDFPFMIPALLGALALWISAKRDGWIARAGSVVTVIGALGSAALCWLFPQPIMPPHSGPHGVGTRTIEIPGEGTEPPLMVQLWYPAEASEDAEHAPWLGDPALAPSFPFSRISTSPSGSIREAALLSSTSPFKVIFYEHAWMGHRAENVALVEDLASEGFVVVAIDHPGQALKVSYPDGSVVDGTLPRTPDFSTKGLVASFEGEARRCLELRHQEISRVVAALSNGAIPEFTKRLGLERMGIFGFSFGGTSAIHECAMNSAFRCGANLDGLYLDDRMPGGPFLFMDEEMPSWLMSEATSTETEEQALIRRCEARIQHAMKGEGRERLVLENTRHASFSDQIFVCALPRIARAGRRSSDEIHFLIQARLTTFFKTTL